MFLSKSQPKLGKRRIIMPFVHVKKNFQITIPQQLRSVLKIKEGDIMEAEIEGELIVLKPKSVVDRLGLNRQEWVNELIETGIKNPVEVREGEIIKGCREVRKEIYKEKYGKS